MFLDQLQMNSARAGTIDIGDNSIFMWVYNITSKQLKCWFADSTYTNWKSNGHKCYCLDDDYIKYTRKNYYFSHFGEWNLSTIKQNKFAPHAKWNHPSFNIRSALSLGHW